MNALNFKPRNKAEVIDRLLDSIVRLQNLPKESFNYEKFVTKFDFQNACGSVCCWAGWYPLWYAKYSFSWVEGGDFFVSANDCLNTRKCLVDFHGLKDEVIENLFYGKGNFFLMASGMQSTKQKVEEVANKILGQLMKGDRDHVYLADYLLF